MKAMNWVHRLLGQGCCQLLQFPQHRVGQATQQTIGQGSCQHLHLSQHRPGQGCFLECREGMNQHLGEESKGCRSLDRYPSCAQECGWLDRFQAYHRVVSRRLECRLQPLRRRVISRAFVVVVFLIDKSSSRARANIT